MRLAQNHISVRATQDMLNFKNLLSIFKVEFFSYTRFYFDYTTVSMQTHTNWYEYFLKKEVPGSANVFNLMTGCNLWSQLFPTQAMNDAYNFNIGDGILFSYRYHTYIELISFATKKEDIPALNILLSNIDMLEKFIVYFKEQGSNLIIKAENERIIVPEVMRGFDTTNTNLKLNSKRRAFFLETIGYGSKLKNLTKREKEVLYSSSHGMTAKEIARKLHISPRTVETHIDNMKVKLSCQNKMQLTEIFWMEKNLFYQGESSDVEK